MCFLKLHVASVSTQMDMLSFGVLKKKSEMAYTSTHYLVLSFVGDLVFLQLGRK